MVFPIVGGDGKPTGYDVENSLRFNNDDSALLSLVQTAGNRRTLTFSTWLKRSTLGDQNIYNGSDSSSEFTAIYFTSADELFLYDYRGAEGMAIKTTRKFRDVSAWYHIVVAYDTTQSTASNRVKIYVNGVQETDFSTANYPAQNLDLMLNVNSAFTTRIGRYPTQNNLYFDGYMCETAVVEDSQLQPTSFGEFDDNNVWIPKDFKDDVTFGSEGFYLEYKQTGTSQNSSGIGADTSGNDNHFAVSNFAALDVTEDTCTNNFATLNSLDQGLGNAAVSEGNCKFAGADGDTCRARSTLAVANGKWYAEFRVANNHKLRISVTDNVGMETNGPLTNDGVDFGINDGYLYTYKDGTNNDTGAGSVSGGIDLSYTHSSNDIIGVALDADNNTVRFYVNGSAQGSEATVLQRATEDVFHMFSVYDFSSSGNNANTVECNFGNPSYSISSGNNDGLYGNFEYAPPSGYYALCTKRLGSFG